LRLTIAQTEERARNLEGSNLELQGKVALQQERAAQAEKELAEIKAGFQRELPAEAVHAIGRACKGFEGTLASVRFAPTDAEAKRLAEQIRAALHAGGLDARPVAEMSVGEVIDGIEVAFDSANHDKPLHALAKSRALARRIVAAL